MDIMGMMKKAQTIQKKLQEAQEELANEEITVEVQNGAVKVTLDGKAQFKTIKLSKEAINSENPESVDDDTVEMLEDLITTAIKQATEQASSKMEAKMKSITGGISIPGLF
ncbi:YbaB/EbfC family nucleoid-associated protein [bacterium]|nr:YbaB/EbfC family nucleoid-associated protein [bacterium]